MLMPKHPLLTIVVLAIRNGIPHAEYYQCWNPVIPYCT